MQKNVKYTTNKAENCTALASGQQQKILQLLPYFCKETSYFVVYIKQLFSHIHTYPLKKFIPNAITVFPLAW